MAKIQIKEDKLKPLQPTLRQKKRFIRVKIESEKKFNFDEISKELNQEITFYIGAIDFGKAGIWILKDKFDFDNQEIIIRVGTKFKDKTVGALALIRKIGSENLNLRVLRVSGTLKGVYKE